MAIIFTQINHPLSIGLIVLLQTIIISILRGFISQRFWFSYVLFLVFLGGILILFIYVTSLASNEIFYLSTKISLLTLILLSILFTINEPNILVNNIEIITERIINNDIINQLIKLYNRSTGRITIMLAIYLFLTLIAVVKITSVSRGPLRKLN